MAWSRYQLGLAALMLLTGSINTLAAKWADNFSAPGCDGTEEHKFQHPFLQAAGMFLGEFSCLPVFYLLLLRDRRRTDRDRDQDGDPAPAPSRPFNALLFLPPALCDMAGTSIMYVALNMTSASSFQMLRGSLIIFTGLLSVAFLGRRLEWSHWAGIVLTILGLALVGMADLRGNPGGAGHGLADVITGIPGMPGHQGYPRESRECRAGGTGWLMSSWVSRECWGIPGNPGNARAVGHGLASSQVSQECQGTGTQAGIPGMPGQWDSLGTAGSLCRMAASLVGMVGLFHGMAGSLYGMARVTPWDHGKTSWNGEIIPWNGRVTPWDGGKGPWSGRKTSRNGGITPWSWGETSWNGGISPWDGGITPWNDGITPWNSGKTFWNLSLDWWDHSME
ncbi:solute carrier family 35 member F6 isoform X2 [Agelaius tricolor]|uniref:solute carrier family 35 member F6 isoform X2 n=1 Tax=Agelaius tricolor TaxID=9191 RepID=UPI0039F201DA